jgi:DNA-binding XRE family transcriptional regulator
MYGTLIEQGGGLEGGEMPSLRELRLRKMWSQRDLSAEAAVARKTIVDLELGRVEPRLQTMRKLAEALGVEPLEVDEFQQAIEEKVAA